MSLLADQQGQLDANTLVGFASEAPLSSASPELFGGRFGASDEGVQETALLAAQALAQQGSELQAKPSSPELLRQSFAASGEGVQSAGLLAAQVLAEHGSGLQPKPSSLEFLGRSSAASDVAKALPEQGSGLKAKPSSLGSFMSGGSTSSVSPLRPGSATATAAKASATAAKLCAEIHRLRKNAALASSCDAALALRIERSELLRLQEIQQQERGRLLAAEAAAAARAASGSPIRRAGATTIKPESARPALVQIAESCRLAQIAQLLRETAKHSRACLAAALQAWKERSSWPGALEAWGRDLHRPSLQLELFHLWQSAVCAGRQHRLASALQQQITEAMRASEADAAGITASSAQARHFQSQAAGAQLWRWRTARLRAWAWREWAKATRRVYVSRSCRGHRHRASLVQLRRSWEDTQTLALRAWQNFATKHRRRVKALLISRGFKLVTFSLGYKDLLILATKLWRSCTARDRLQLGLLEDRSSREELLQNLHLHLEERHDASRQRLHFRAASQLASSMRQGLLLDVLLAWQLAHHLHTSNQMLSTMHEELLRQGTERRRLEACSLIAAALTRWEQDSFLKQIYFYTWALLRPLSTAEEHKNQWESSQAQASTCADCGGVQQAANLICGLCGARRKHFHQTLTSPPTFRAALVASTASFYAASEKCGRMLESEKRLERGLQIRLACRLLTRVVEPHLDRSMRRGLRRWHLASMRCHAALLADHSSREQAKIRVLKDEVDGMRVMAACYRRLALPAIFRCYKSWRLGLSTEAFRVWAVAARLLLTERQERDRDNEADAVDRDLGLAEKHRRNVIAATLHDMLESAEIQRLLQLSWQAWLTDLGVFRVQLQGEAMKTHHADASALRLQLRVGPAKKTYMALAAWMTQKSGISDEIPPAIVRLVLRAWFVACQAEHRAQVGRQRRRQIHRDVWGVCVETAEWIDSMSLRKVFWIWLLAWKEASQIEQMKSMLAASKAKRASERRLMKLMVQARSKLQFNVDCWSMAQDCLAAWNRYLSIRKADKRYADAFARLDGRIRLGRQALRRSKEVLGDALHLAMKCSGGSPGAVARLVARRIFPWWRRQALFQSAKRRLQAREEENLRIVEELRGQAKQQQLRWASWAAGAQPRVALRQNASEVLAAWRRLCRSSRRQLRYNRSSLAHEAGLNAAEKILLRSAARSLRTCFVAWRRLKAEEKVFTLEDRVRKLEASLARAAGEEGLSLPQLEQRLAFEDSFEAAEVAAEASMPGFLRKPWTLQNVSVNSRLVCRRLRQ
eukprot:TRINITY_DN88959_c0_g1_i1.p1 TRINITY_DN88959_c0_g1~~TRINITY_DN88959_c0_g1_i1.p1  ORF type:complete len:1269 (+),score=277.79 TRINITY_DN88959_c0_g1_i1:28-3834(+)